MNNDLISREALKENGTVIGIVNGQKMKVIPLSFIDNAPTVEPEKVLVANVTFDKDQLEQIVRDEVIEPIKNGELVLQTDEKPQGEWKLHGMIYYCSECGHECGESGDNFCGNCGAEMRKGDEAE